MPRIKLNEVLEDCFGSDAELQSWLEVEAALARVQSQMGVIPVEAAEAIGEAARLECIDRTRLAEAQEETNHPILPMLKQLERLAGPNHGNWVHYGATTQNIVQTGFILRLKRAHALLLYEFRLLVGRWADAAEQYRDVVMTGRTHGQPAVPITFGFKIAGWLNESIRHFSRVQSVEKRVFACMMGGAAGTCASFGSKGIEVQVALARELELASASLPSRVILDHLAEYGQTLTLLCGTVARSASDLFQLMKPECGEIFHDDGSVGSSTMPQKRNPVLHSDALAAWKMVRTRHALLPECLAGEGEGNPNDTWPMMDALADISRLAFFMIQRQIKAMDTLKVNADRMGENIARQGKWILSEGLMLKLADSLGREGAHDRMHKCAMKAREKGKCLEDMLSGDEELARVLDRSGSVDMFDPANYTGDCGKLVDATVAAARKALQLH